MEPRNGAAQWITRALSTAMTARYFPTGAHVLVCRGVHCSARNPELYAHATEFAEREYIAYYRKGGSVRITASSCLGACDHGPILLCYREDGSKERLLQQAWFSGVKPQMAESILTALQNKTALPKEGRFDE